MRANPPDFLYLFMETTYNPTGTSLDTVVSGQSPVEVIKVGFWRRLPAFLIDIIILQILKEIIISPLKFNLSIDETTFASLEDIIQNFEAFVTYILLSIIVYLSISCFYFTQFYGSTGQSVGKKLMGIKVIPVTGGMMTYKKALVRYLGYLISEIPFFFGFIWIAIDKDKQGWHDRIAGTYVVKGGD